MKFFLQISFILLCLSCSNEAERSKEKKVSSRNKKSAIQAPTFKISEKQNPEGNDPIIIQTCNWDQYKFVTIGSPDYKGRYSYEYEVFTMVNNEEIKVQNSDIFNSKIGTLEGKINKAIAKEINDNRKYPDNLECLSEVEDPKFSINDMGITIDEKNRMIFSVSLGLGGACFNVDGASANFSLNEIRNYLK